jgi:hypothetical protein
LKKQSVVQKLDDRLCDFFQAVSDWIEGYFCIHCFSLARTSLLVSVGFAMLAYREFLSRSFILVIVVTLWTLITFVNCILVSITLERKSDRPGFMNPERLEFGKRIITMILLLLMVIKYALERDPVFLYMAGHLFFLTVYGYFVSCTRKPSATFISAQNI